MWAAFADPEIKRKWFGSDEFVYVERTDDFRVGGVAIDDGRHGEGGPLSQFRATYTDITPNERIVYTYDMWLDGVHASTSITTIVFEPTDDGAGPGTQLTFTEQGVHLDGPEVHHEPHEGYEDDQEEQRQVDQAEGPHGEETPLPERKPERLQVADYVLPERRGDQAVEGQRAQHQDDEEDPVPA